MQVEFVMYSFYLFMQISHVWLKEALMVVVKVGFITGAVNK